MEKIGPYEITGELGRGGMGIVYRGVDPVIGRAVAIKTLHAADLGEATERDSMQERLLREAKSAGILSHPSIVTIYQAGKDGDVVFIAMEFIEGLNLADMLSRGRLTIEAVLGMLRQTAEALDYAHSKGVIHRDVKPSNVLIQPDGRVKVADFGIAKLGSSSVTKTGATVGSPAYMSPEHVRAMPVDGRADQYSLGIMAFEMLTGRRPYDSDTLTSLVFMVVFEKPDLTPLKEIPGGEAAIPVFEKVLAKAREDRFETCSQFWSALTAAMTGVTPQVFTSPLESGSAAAIAAASTATVVSPGASTTGGGSKANGSPLQDRPAFTATSSTAQATPASAPAHATTAAAPPKSKKTGLIAGLALGAALIGGGAWYAITQASNPAPPTLPQLIRNVPPAYTVEAQQKGIQGEVGLVFEVSETGETENIRVEKSLDPGLDQQAIEAVKQWKFTPATRDGKPVRWSGPAEIAFRLEEEKPKQ